jgi:hypothetical protein
MSNSAHLTGDAVEIVVEFSYPGPYSNFPGGSGKADSANMSAEKIVENTLKAGGFKFYHEYSWPDGSLYKAVVVPEGKSPEEVEKELSKFFQGSIRCGRFYRYKTGEQHGHQDRLRE